MRKDAFLPALLVGVAAALLFGAFHLREDLGLSGSLVRLHVIAASDTQADQARKLLVRDAVLEALEDLAPRSAQDAVAVLQTRLPELAQCALRTLDAAGYAEPVTVRLCTEAYPTRDYGAFALPAGEYVSLQIRIGSAEGRNWWCVVYPGLCTAAARGDWVAAAESAGLTDGQIRLMRVDPCRVQFRFKLLELLQKFMELF